MKRTSALAGAALAAMTLTTPAFAQEWIFGLGYSDFSRPGAQNGAQVSVEYQHTPFYEKGRFSAGFAGALSVQDEGDVFVGAGIATRLSFDNQWFVETSVMPGAYFESHPGNDLGSTFEIRSLLGVGYDVNPGNSVSLALAHKSNASTATTNPGVNTLLLRWHRAY